MSVSRKEGKGNDEEVSGESRRRSILQTLVGQAEASRTGCGPGEANDRQNQCPDAPEPLDHHEGQGEAEARGGEREGRFGCGDRGMNEGEDQDRGYGDAGRLEREFPGLETPKEKEQTDRKEPPRGGQAVHHFLAQGALEEQPQVHQDEGQTGEDQKIEAPGLQCLHDLTARSIRGRKKGSMSPMNQAETRLNEAFAGRAEGAFP